MKLLSYIERRRLARGQRYEFQQLLLEIGEEAVSENVENLVVEKIDFTEILSLEALRILKRKRQSESEERITQDTVDMFEEWIKKKEDENEEIENKEIGLSELVFEMIIANEFASAFDMAKMEGNL